MKIIELLASYHFLGPILTLIICGTGFAICSFVVWIVDSLRKK